MILSTIITENVYKQITHVNKKFQHTSFNVKEIHPNLDSYVNVSFVSEYFQYETSSGVTLYPRERTRD